MDCGGDGKQAMQGDERPRPTFEGVRVVELATHIAGPLVGRVLGDLGAEVIKVESPEGDIFRNTFVQFERPRTHGTAFELMNLSKAGIQIDLKSAAGRQQLLKLLAEADVFVTNVRTPSLAQLGLTWEDLAPRFPRLVYARCTAWGAAGPDSGRPGYDIGAFWTATGASATVNNAPNFSLYLPGYGDITTSQSLVAGVAFALAQRGATGIGQLVDSTLLRVGAWTVAGALAEVRDQTQDLEGRVPVYGLQETEDTLRAAYLLHDGESAVLVAEEGRDEPTVYRQLAIALGLGAVVTGEGDAVRLPCEFPRGSSGAAQAHAAWIARLVPAFWLLDSEQAGRVLSEHGVPHVVTVPADEATLHRDDDAIHVQGAVWDDPRAVGVTDLCRSPRLPYEVGVGRQPQHGPQCRAPNKGEHTDDILQHGWRPRRLCMALPAEAARPTIASACSPALTGLSVVELPWTDSVAVAAATVMLADLGAAVLTLRRRGDTAGLENGNPQLFAQLNRGKSQGANADVKALAVALSTADMLVTDYPRDALQALGVEIIASRDGSTTVVGFPALAVVIVTPWGLQGNSSDNRGLLGSGFASTPGCHVFSGVSQANPRKITLPRFHSLDLAVSVYTLAACGIACYHAVRGGRGAVIDVNVHRIGTWINMIGIAWGTKDPRKIRGFSIPKEHAHMHMPLPTYNCHGLRCGMWVQLLGLDVPRHLGRLLAALGLRMSVATMVAYTLVRHVLPNRRERSWLVRLLPIIRVINSQIAAAMAHMDYMQFQQLAAKHDIWWCPVRVPQQLLHYPQAEAAGTWVTDPATLRRQVACPLQMTRATTTVPAQPVAARL